MWGEKRNTAGDTKQPPLLNKGGSSDDEEYDGDYSSKWEYLGKGIWENQVEELSCNQPHILESVGTLNKPELLGLRDHERLQHP